jgi:hypothetical protein
VKWSTLSYGFARKEDRNAKEELQAGRDRIFASSVTGFDMPESIS